MKSTSALSVLALVVSLIALGMVLSIERESLNQAEIDALVDEGIKRKEKAFVDEYNPFMQRIYQDMMMPVEYAEIEKEPETIEELFKPLIRVFMALTG